MRIGWKLILFANRESHTGCALAPKLVTLSNLEQRQVSWSYTYTHYSQH